MKKFVLALAITILAAVPAATAPLVSCAKLEWSEAKTANPAPADILALQCHSRFGDPGAGFILAMLTKTGRGVPADPKGAREQLKVLATGRNGGEIRGALGARTRSYALDASGAAAEEWLTAGYPPAMRELAKMMLLGQGGDKDVPAAMHWLNRAREKDKEAAILHDALKAKGF
ncbi:hypothetical protein IP88_16240 [alpha proteobacterium AAP81b]|nr:hypothetical protein IP88_16240 [alpha proteobacterium AAP81b]